MALISYVNQNLTQATAFDTAMTSGDDLFVSSNSTLVMTAVGNAFQPFVDDVDYFIYGEVYGGWDSYADKVRITIGENGSITDPIGFMQMNHAHIWNHGTLTSNSNMVISKYDDPVNDPAWLNDLIIFNTGNIIGNSNDIYADLGTIVSSGERTEIINHGLISGFEKAIRVIENATGDGEAEIRNYGTIDGDIDLDTTTVDMVITHGSIFGDVTLGGGNDIYRAFGDGFTSGTVYGEGGNDELKGAGTDDTLDGGGGLDTLRGKGGDDDLNGGSGRDVIYGNGGNDLINGGNQADILSGGRGDDVINGGSGSDVITGGLGDDVLTGNGQADIFVMNFRAGNDTITDFDDGNDLIDITAFGLSSGDFATDVAPGLATQGSGVSLDLSVLGGSGVLLIEFTALADISAADFIF
jgi:Ca2+-binding RTX toxin-like protein